MRYTLEVTGKRSFSAINVDYKEERLQFRGGPRVNCGNSDQELFEFINIFLSNRTEPVLDKHWDLLKQAKRIIEPGYFHEPDTEETKENRKNNMDYKYIVSKLTPIFIEIYENITTKDIIESAQWLGYLNPPNDLNNMTRRGDYPEETTINAEKYKELAKLTFSTQLSFPIISQFLDHIVLVTGKEFKDAVVGELLEAVPAITEQRGFNILETYLNASFARQESRRNSITVVSEVKYVRQVVYKGLFSKLCLTFLPSKILNKNISNELNSLVEGEIRNSSDIRFKSFGDPKPGGDDLSIQESYLISQEVNGSDERAQAEYFSYSLYIEKVVNQQPVLERVYSGFFKDQCLGLGIRNQDMAEKIYNNLPVSWPIRLTDIQVKLLQLVYQYDLSYRIFEAMNYEQLMAALTLAQVKLFEMGFENLAVCIFAVRDETVPKTFIDDSYRLNTKEREYLVSICDDYIGQQTGSTDNSAVISVTDFLNELASSGWVSNIEIGLLGNQKYVDMISGTHTYPIEVSGDVKREFLELIKTRN